MDFRSSGVDHSFLERTLLAYDESLGDSLRVDDHGTCRLRRGHQSSCAKLPWSRANTLCATAKKTMPMMMMMAMRRLRSTGQGWGGTTLPASVLVAPRTRVSDPATHV